MSVAVINSNELYYETTGSGSPVILVHGSWTDHSTWIATVPLLAENHTVIAYDRRGHSESEAPPGQGRVGEDVNDLLGLIEHIGLGPASIVGNSFGGTIALFAATTGSSLVRSIAVHEPDESVVDPDSVDFGDSTAVSAFMDLQTQVIDLLREGQTEAGTKLFMEGAAFGPVTWDHLPEVSRAMWIGNAGTFLDEMQDDTLVPIEQDVLRSVECPVLLTYGSDELPTGPAVIHELARHLPNAVVHEFAGSGHIPHRTHPDH